MRGAALIPATDNQLIDRKLISNYFDVLKQKSTLVYLQTAHRDVKRHPLV